MVRRPLLVAPVLGLFLFYFHSTGATPEAPFFYFLIFLRGTLTFSYIFFFQRSDKQNWIMALQLFFDLLIESLLIGISGNVESPFSILYIATIVAAAFFFFEKGGIVTATLALLSLSVTVFIKGGEASPSSSTSILAQIPYGMSLHAIAFYSIGIMSGRFFNRTHEESIGLSKLRVLHEDIVESIPNGVVTTDSDGRITSFNQAAYDITGVTSKEAIGQVWWKIFSWEEIKVQYQYLKQLGIPQRFEGEILRKEGTPCFLEVTISPLRNDEGKTMGVIGIFRDLTLLKRMEEEMHQKRWLALVGEMAAGMAHEIRNPLASLSGSIQLLKDEPAMQMGNRRLMEIALHETDRLNGIITEFLLYAKPLPPRKQWITLHDLLVENIEFIKKTDKVALGTNVLLEIPDPLLEVFVDPDQLEQVFLNLAINAFFAMPAGGSLTITVKTVDFQTRSGENEKAEIEFCFRDTGTGISEEDLPKIFYPFFTTKNEGSGLGLSIVQRIIDQHDGTIGVTSSAAGTLFRILIPICKKS
ncbi:MAG: ATP-binding protein [Nitrospirota bacterium]